MKSRKKYELEKFFTHHRKIFLDFTRKVCYYHFNDKLYKFILVLRVQKVT